MYPKQLLPLTGSRTMLQETVHRLDGLPGRSDECLVICNETHRFLVAEQLQEQDVAAKIVLEPEARNTAPAVALAAFLAAASDSNDLLLVLPADHVIEDAGAFRDAVGRGVAAADDGRLVTFGIVPGRPETGYGYIQAKRDGDNVCAVESFVEKPDHETALAYLAGGKHFWNSGMFLFSAQACIDHGCFEAAFLQCTFNHQRLGAEFLVCCCWQF